MSYLQSLLRDLPRADDLVAGVIRRLATGAVTLTRRCDWVAASASVEAWEQRASRPAAPRRAAITWAIIDGVLIVLTAMLVYVALASLGRDGGLQAGDCSVVAPGRGGALWTRLTSTKAMTSTSP